MLTTVASSSTRCEKANSDSRAPPMDTRAPTTGIPAATKPAKTKNITRKVSGRAMPSPRSRSRSTVLVIALITLLVLPSVPFAPIAAGTGRSFCSACASAVSCAALSSPGLKSTTVTKPPAAGDPPFSRKAVLGSVTPAGESSGERTLLTPGTRASSCVAAAPLATVAGSVRSAPVTCIVSVWRAGSLWAMTSWAREDSDSTVGAPEWRRSNRDSPVTPPTATAKQAAATTAQTATQVRGWRAIAPPSRARRVRGVGPAGGWFCTRLAFHSDVEQPGRPLRSGLYSRARRAAGGGRRRAARRADAPTLAGRGPGPGEGAAARQSAPTAHRGLRRCGGPAVGDPLGAARHGQDDAGAP